MRFRRSHLTRLSTKRTTTTQATALAAPALFPSSTVEATGLAAVGTGTVWTFSDCRRVAGLGCVVAQMPFDAYYCGLWLLCSTLTAAVSPER